MINAGLLRDFTLGVLGLVMIIIIVKKYIHSCRTAFTISIVFSRGLKFRDLRFQGLMFRGLSFRDINRDHTI